MLKDKQTDTFDDVLVILVPEVSWLAMLANVSWRSWFVEQI